MDLEKYLELHAGRSILLHVIERVRKLKRSGPSPDISATVRMLLMQLQEFEIDIHGTKPDNCQRCHGERGGVLGNEVVIGDEVLCDYCHADDIGSGK